MRVYIGIRVNPVDGDKEIQIVTVSLKEINDWIDAACTAEPDVTFLYTLRRVRGIV